jgi:glycosyltransferase involved in cell wall biosynthesis
VSRSGRTGRTPFAGASGVGRPAEVRPPCALSVVVMAFNEVESVDLTVHELLDCLRQQNESFEILVIDDGSVDGTSALVDRLTADIPEVRVVHHEVNRGLGAVYRSGFEYARGDLLTFFPADGQFPASIIPEFLRAMDGREMVLGYLPDRTDSMLGRALSWGERRLYSWLLGPVPRFQGVLMFRRRLLESIDLYSEGRGWVVLMELIVRVTRLGAKTISLPTSVRPRRTGHSKVTNLRTINANLRELWKLRGRV